MYWRRHGGGWAVRAALALLAACGTKPAPGPVPPTTLDPDDLAVIYAAAPTDKWIIGSETVLRPEDFQDWDVQRSKQLSDFLSALMKKWDLPEQTIDQLIERNETVFSLGPFPPGDPLVVAKETMHDAFGEGKRWGGFDKAFPGYRGIYRFSAPVFDPKRQRALLYRQWASGDLEGEGELVVLERTEGGSWKVVGAQMLWVS